MARKTFQFFAVANENGRLGKKHAVAAVLA